MEAIFPSYKMLKFHNAGCANNWIRKREVTPLGLG
jgi:hypothetical protein